MSKDKSITNEKLRITDDDNRNSQLVIRNSNIPKLRFPEFEEEGAWKEERLGNIATIIKDKVGNKEPTLFSIDAERGLISQLEKFGRIIAGKSTPNYFLIKKGDFAYNKSSTKAYPEGQIAVLETHDEGAVPNSIFTCFRFNSEVNPNYAKYLFTHNIHGKWLVNYIAVGARAHGALAIDNKDLLNLPVPFPASLKEQQKIADCLSSLDGVISGEQEKLELLKEHKKGLLQNLFPNPMTNEKLRITDDNNRNSQLVIRNSNVPNYRFPEFRNDGEWEEKTIEQIAKVTTGSKDTQNKVNNGKYPFFVRSQKVEQIDSYSFDGEAILTSGDGVGVGKNFHYINGKFDFHQRVYCIYDFADDVSGLFVYLYFSQHFYERVMRMSAKNSVDSVRMAMITEMPLLIPSKEEQQKIASCLSALDEIIQAQTQRIEQLQQHKKGLMQQLFPKH